MVPKGWEQKKLEELCSLDAPITYGVLKPGEYFCGGIPLLQIKDLCDGSVLSNGLHLISPELDYEYRRSRIIKNDILISLVGTIGRVAKYQSSSEANIHRNIGRIRSNQHEYLFHYLRSDDVQRGITDSASGSSQSALNLSTLRSMLILVPPVIEQKKIAKILSTWDKAISVTEKLLTNSQQQKKALMQQLLTGKKRLLDENGVRFSGEWVYLTFDNAFIVANKKSTQVKSSDYLQSGSIPIIDQGQSRIAGYCNNLEVYSDVPVIVFGDHTRCVKWIEFVFCPGADGTQVIKTSKILEPKLGYYLLSNTDIPNLGYSRHMRELKEKDFRLPLDIKEQQKIAAVLSAADAEISTLEKKLACLKDEKKALMQQLLTGKRRVKVDEAVAE